MMNREPSKIEVQHTFPALDQSLYNLLPQDATFYKEVTGIEDDAALKQHILDIQAKAYKVAPYACIYLFLFTRRRLSALPAYQEVVRIGREWKNPIFLDVGCCFGNDIREVTLDGFPAARAIGTDLRQELWDLGHELFKSTPETFPAHFVGGDAFNPEILTVAPPASMQTAGVPTPDLNKLTSLNPLHGCVSVIHATAFFHLFKEDKQLHMARALAGLLSAEPGSIILGVHTGAQEKSVVNHVYKDVEVDMFAHSAESWTAMWDGEVFEKGTVKVDAQFREISEGAGGGERYPLLYWSVTRL
jgi:SAM-dependent methyltransferase